MAHDEKEYNGTRRKKKNIMVHDERKEYNGSRRKKRI